MYAYKQISKTKTLHIIQSKALLIGMILSKTAISIETQITQHSNGIQLLKLGNGKRTYLSKPESKFINTGKKQY